MNAYKGFLLLEVLILSSVTAEEKIAEDYLPPSGGSLLNKVDGNKEGDRDRYCLIRKQVYPVVLGGLKVLLSVDAGNKITGFI